MADTPTPDEQSDKVKKNATLYESLEKIPDEINTLVKAMDSQTQLIKALQEDKEKDKAKMTEFEKKLEDAAKTKEDDEETVKKQKEEEEEKKKKEEEEVAKQEKDKESDKTKYPYPDKKSFDETMTKMQATIDQLQKVITPPPATPEGSGTGAPQGATPGAPEQPGLIQKFNTPPQGTGNPDKPGEQMTITEWAHKVVEDEGLNTPEKYAEAVRGFNQRDHLEHLVTEFDQIYGDQKEKHLNIAC